MNWVGKNRLIQKTRPINYDISKSLERKFSLGLIILANYYL